MTPKAPRDHAVAAESATTWPYGDRDGVAGYGVMAVTFDSGHILGLRNWTSTSAGTPMKSIWHRFPDGRWEFIEEGAVCPLTCSVWFGPGAPARHAAGVSVEWTGPRSLQVTTDDGYLAWELTVRPTVVTRLMSAMAARIPLVLWTTPWFLRVMGLVATVMMRSGSMGLVGASPNGTPFRANPQRIWRVTSSTATVGGESVGVPAPLDPQAQLGDFWLPQRGLLAMGRVFQPPGG